MRKFRSGFLMNVALFLVLPFILTSSARAECVPSGYDPEFLVPVGRCVGVTVCSKGLLITELTDVVQNGDKCCPARTAGLRPGDMITAVNGSPLTSADDLARSLDAGAVIVSVIRGKKPMEFHVDPVMTPDGARLGCKVRDSMAGLGTITFYDPETGIVGGLGHPICDVDTGVMMSVLQGDFLFAEVTGAKKGAIGSPGCLYGDFPALKSVGKLEDNLPSGVFGYVSDGSYFSARDALPVARSLHTGAATILCNLDGDTVEEFEVEVVSVHNLSDGDLKDMELRVTDKDLISRTGGIVQGMSGSPIIQDGKLVGAVTHVFVNDPRKGYGIFIGTMLKCAACDGQIT